MAGETQIEWSEMTWNPVVGCSKVSPGCAHCYAEELHRTRMNGQGAYPPFKPWTPANAEDNVTLVPERLDQPLRWRRPRMVFVNSMSDLFHELVPDEFIAQVWAVMMMAHDHTFQVLTKRPERARSLLSAPDFPMVVHNAGCDILGPPYTPYKDIKFREEPFWPAPNVWLGTSIENLRFASRADRLRETPAAVRFISAEPLLGPLVPHTERVIGLRDRPREATDGE